MPRLTLLIGLTNSEKHILAQELLKDMPGISYIAGTIATATKQASLSLSKGYDTLVEMPCLSVRSRRQLLAIAKSLDVFVEALVVATPIEYRTPHENVLSGLSEFQMPFYEEGFHKISVISPPRKAEENFLKTTWANMECLFQRNAHHNHLLSTHCEDSAELFLRYGYGRDYNFAARFHDVGKLFTKSVGLDGREHYYHHENVGAYHMLVHKQEVMSEAILSTNEFYNALFLINYHMLPLKWKDSERSLEKWKGILGDEKYKLICDFNACDKSRELEILRGEAER